MRRFRRHLIDRVARETKLSRIIVGVVVEALARAIAEELAQGNSVVWIGLGTWSVKERQSLLPGSKPFQGGRMRRVVFRAGRPLRRRLRDQANAEDP